MFNIYEGNQKVSEVNRELCEVGWVFDNTKTEKRWRDTRGKRTSRDLSPRKDGVPVLPTSHN